MTKINTYKNLPLIQLGKNINASKEIIEYCPKIFNKRSLSALDNYATHKNISIRFSKLNTDMYGNTQIFMSSKNAITKSLGLKTKIDVLTKQSYVESLRSIYNLIAKNIENLKFSK